MCVCAARSLPAHAASASTFRSQTACPAGAALLLYALLGRQPGMHWPPPHTRVRWLPAAPTPLYTELPPSDVTHTHVCVRGAVALRALHPLPQG